jgi:hypothetical protein
MDSLLTQSRKASRDPRDCRNTIDALRDMGFSDDSFPALHHQHGSSAVFYSYCGGVQRFREDDNNHRVHQRLTYVLLSCPGGAPPKAKSFQTLAEEAFRLIPSII